MKKYLLFTLEFPPMVGGVSNYYYNLVRYWGMDKISVLTEKNLKGPGQRLKNGNIFYRRLLCPCLRYKWLPAVWHLFWVKLFKQVDHVIVGQILPLGTAAYLLKKVFKKMNYSVILHGMDFSYALKDKKKMELSRKILNNSIKIICANTYTAKLVKQFDSRLGAKISVVNPGIRSTRPKYPETVKKLKDKYALWKRTVMLSVGRLVKRKGFDKMIEVLPESLKKELDLYYIIVGDGPDKRYLEKRAEKLPNKARRRVIFTGEASEKEIWAWMEICDVLAMPSRDINGDFEGFGIVYLEANLAGKPVIAGDSGGVRDAVMDGVNGLLVDPQNNKEITKAVIKLCRDKELRKKLGQKGKEIARKRFNWRGQINKLRQILTH
ncbi:glycosyltransferase [Candidatus Falkowbacteria bacterium]|nr:glycosyltransferase [Candidatus Falkowbacteria bacterium]